MRGDWQRQKEDAVRGIMNYDYFTGLYDGNKIPTSVFKQGFSATNHSRENALGDFANRAPTVPQDRREKGPNAGYVASGYASFTPYEVLLDLAPIIPYNVHPVAGNLGTFVNRFPIGEKDADGRWSGVMMRFKPSPDPGNAIGTLDAPEFPRHGSLLTPQLPQNFFSGYSFV
jgi:hypothetical protein